MAANPRATQVALVVFVVSYLGVCENLVRIGGHTQTV
jgi:hypothetical protein